MVGILGPEGNLKAQRRFHFSKHVVRLVVIESKTEVVYNLFKTLTTFLYQIIERIFKNIFISFSGNQMWIRVKEGREQMLLQILLFSSCARIESFFFFFFWREKLFQNIQNEIEFACSSNSIYKSEIILSILYFFGNQEQNTTHLSALWPLEKFLDNTVL